MEQYKQEYNNLLKRYKNGCKYLEEHPEEEKYLKNLLQILEDMNKILSKYNIDNEDIILNGFKQ